MKRDPLLQFRVRRHVQWDRADCRMKRLGLLAGDWRGQNGDEIDALRRGHSRHCRLMFQGRTGPGFRVEVSSEQSEGSLGQPMMLISVCLPLPGTA